MKKYIVIPVVALVFATGCGNNETPKQDVVPKQNMALFNTALGSYMAAETGGMVEIKAECDPLKNGATNCRITLTGPDGTIDTATAENVRQTGDKFTWDRES